MGKSYLIFVVLCLGVLLLAVVLAGANIGIYVSLPALIIVVLLPSCIVIGVFGLSAFFTSFKNAFIGTETTKSELATGSALFSLFSRCLLLTGFITSMIGLIALLGELKEPGELGRTIALALITLFYSLILVFLVTLPYKYAYDRRLIEVNGENR